MSRFLGNLTLPLVAPSTPADGDVYWDQTADVIKVYDADDTTWRTLSFASSGTSISAGTSLPSSPTDGDVYIYNADTTDGVKWMFQYRNAGASGKKWEFIGGSPLYEEDPDTRSTTSTSYVSVPTDPITITIPLAGDYDIEIQSSLYTLGSGYGVNHSYAISSYNSGNASDDWAVSQSNTLTGISAAKVSRHYGLSASATLTEKLRSTHSSATGVILARRIIVTPVRVG